MKALSNYGIKLYSQSYSWHQTNKQTVQKQYASDQSTGGIKMYIFNIQSYSFAILDDCFLRADVLLEVWVRLTTSVVIFCEGNLRIILEKECLMLQLTTEKVCQGYPLDRIKQILMQNYRKRIGKQVFQLRKIFSHNICIT